MFCPRSLVSLQLPKIWWVTTVPKEEKFCMNKLQSKRVVKTPEDRMRWEKEVVETLLNLCKLCSIDKNIKNCKFYYAMELIMRNRLYKFSSFR